MLKTMLMCKACTEYKSASQFLLGKHYQWKEKISSPLPLVTRSKITVYKNCIGMPVPGVIACLLVSIV